MNGLRELETDIKFEEVELKEIDILTDTQAPGIVGAICGAALCGGAICGFGCGGAICGC